MDFNLQAEYAPTGDQPQAIEKLVSPLTKSKPLSVFHKRDIADSRLGLKAQLAET